MSVLSKKIKTAKDLEKFKKSDINKDIKNFISDISKHLIDKAQIKESEYSNILMNVLNDLNNWIDEIPPMKMEMRYGNKSFRNWHQKLENEFDNLFSNFASKSHFLELKGYFNGSFGNPIRLDYGTGHEFCFFLFLLCCYRLKIFSEDDFSCLALSIFPLFLICSRLNFKIGKW
ncbi:Serine/threonine-protein phosphatase 2A activator 2 [Bonamia ostreae]|uniref:Serine/threonine-protein phosphatase 2A activator n=1 Tax=Bonamia ostreae TaxID=126728 RepID=A0ABV2AN53_9EUKA